MVDSGDIEQLRALAFASIPAAARKAQQALGVSSKKKGGGPQEKEEGELSSDDENAEAVPATQSQLAVISASQLLGVSNGAVKVKRRSSIVFESCPPITVDTPVSATVVCEPITLSEPQVSGDSNLQGSSSAVPGKDGNGSESSTRTSAVKYREASIVPQRLLGAPASLPLSIGSGLWPVGGVRKEADAFLAGLNIPLISNSSHLPAFPAEKNNSLVIKFSDEDSDSDVEQHHQTNCGQAQTGRNGVENRNLIGNGLLKTNLLNQPTGGLKSEIDRVKKQIAAIERIKSKPGVSTASKKSGKFTAMDVSKQVSSKPRQCSKSGSTQTIPVDLESLRKQIAAKESELQLRKQRGLRELTSAPAATSFLDATQEAIHNNFACLENSVCHIESEATQEGVMDAPVLSVLDVNARSHGLDVSYLKNVSMEEMQGSEPGDGSEQQNCSLSDWTAAKVIPMGESRACGSPIESIRTGSIAQPVECISMHNSGNSVVCETREPSQQLSDGMGTITKMNNIAVNVLSRTPKRKQNETESSKKSPTPSSERFKKQKKMEFLKQPRTSVSLEDSLRKNVMQVSPERSQISLPASAGQSLSFVQCREVSQGITATVSPVMKSQQGINLQEGSKVKMLISGLMNIKDQKGASDALAAEVAVMSSLGNENSRTAFQSIAGANADCAVSQSANFQNNGLGENLSSDQMTRVPRIAGLTSPRNDNHPKSNASKESQICRDMATSHSSYLSKAIIKMKGDSARFSESQKDLQGVIAGTNPTGLSHPVWTSESQLQKSNLGVFQGLLEQGHEFGHASVNQLQEEENLVDKELEEAQQSRRRCEVREHLARRQYRDAQEALQSANLRCEILYQKREMLAARIKAAELQYLQTKAIVLPPVQPQDRTLVPLGFSNYPGRASFGFGTSLGVAEDQQLPNLPVDQKFHLKNSFSEPVSATVKELSRNLRKRSQLDSHLEIDSSKISDIHCTASDPGPNASHHCSDNLDLQNNNYVGPILSSGQIAQLETDLRPPPVDGSVHHQVGEGEVEEHNEANRNIGFVIENSILSELNEMEMGSVLAERIRDKDRSPGHPEIITSVSTSTSDSCGLNVPALVPINAEGSSRKKRKPMLSSPNFVQAAPSHGLEKECSHGFSSASFARDLDGDASNNIPGLKDAIGNNRIHQFALEGKCISNQNFSSHGFEPVSIITFDSSHGDCQTFTLETETGLDYPGMDVSNVECYSKALFTLPISDSNYANKSGTCLAEGKDIELTNTDSSQFQHFDDAKRRGVLYLNEEAATILNDGPALQGDGQDFGILAKVQDANTRFDDDKSVQRVQDKHTIAKENAIQSMELCKEDFLAKESGCARATVSGVGLQIDKPDDLQASTKLDRLETRKEFNREALELEGVKAPDGLELHLFAAVKDVVNDLQSDSIQNATCGTGFLFSMKYLEQQEIGLSSQRDDQRSTFEMPSAKVKLLFGHLLNLKICEHTEDSENRQDSHFTADESNLILPIRYESPLCTFRSYRSCSQFTDVFNLSTYSNTWAHDIDPFKLLCKYEHRGKCNNDDCRWQHKRDYVLNSNQVLDQLHTYDEVNKIMVGRDSTGRPEADDICTTPSHFSDGTAFNKDQKQGGKIVMSPAHLQKSPPSRLDLHILKASIYRLGSYLVKASRFTSLLSLKHQSRFGQSLSIPLPVSRQVPIDMPCLLDSSIRFSTLGNGLTSSEQFPVGNRSQVEVEGYYSDSFEDVESLLEAALNFIDFDLNAVKSESQKNALYVLSRGLEAKSSSVALWVVYLHLFYRWEKGLGEDDLFYHAVQHNMGSYELWMMFINTRRHVTERMEAYKSAIMALGSMVENQANHPAGKSSYVLDLFLRMLNCLCVAGLSQQAVGWINDLTVFASEDVQGLEGHDVSCASILLTCLTKHDLCILWVCCAYIILQSQLPSNIIGRLGCKQELPLFDIWQYNKNQLSCGSYAMRLMHIAASDGRGCLALDSVTSLQDKDTEVSREAMAINFVQCAAVCEEFDSSLTLADKYLNLYPSSVELILVRVNLEEHFKDKTAGLSIFEQALSRWPLHQAGKMRLWSQYIGYAFDTKGSDFVKVLFARCAAQVQDDSDRCSCLGKAVGSVHVPNAEREPDNNHKGLQLREQDLDDSVRLAFESIPSILKLQHSKGSKTFKQCFSNQDAVFGFLNLAFFEALTGRVVAANEALDRALKLAADAGDVQHCLKEIAALIFCGSTNSNKLSSFLQEHKMLNLFDRCFTESQLLNTLHPLSKGFCESIKRRRVRHFVTGLLGPWPIDNSLVNNILETIYGPTLLPEERVTMKELIDFVEKMMDVTPSNLRLAGSASRAVQSRVDDYNAVTRNALLYWSAGLLVNSLCQSPQEVPESLWLEAAKIVELLGVDSLLEDFYQHALAAYPFSKALWNGLLAVSSRTGNSKIAVEAACEKGVRLDIQPGS